jgi:hypothetical protein
MVVSALVMAASIGGLVAVAVTQPKKETIWYVGVGGTIPVAGVGAYVAGAEAEKRFQSHGARQHARTRHFSACGTSKSTALGWDNRRSWMFESR